MIRVTCPSCKKSYKAEESVLGMSVKCMGCGNTFEVQPVHHPNYPETEPKAAATSADPEADRKARREQAADQASSAVFAEPAVVSSGGGITEVTEDPPKHGATTKPHRPFGLVWIVFYWTIAGLLCLPAAYLLLCMGGIMEGASEFGRSVFGNSGSHATGVEVLIFELGGLLLFHYGLLLLVSCYGLWTYRRWGLSLARGLAVTSVVLSVGALVICLYTRAGIVGCVLGLALSVWILIYLYGSANLRDRLRQYVHSQALEGGQWAQYE